MINFDDVAGEKRKENPNISLVFLITYKQY